MTLFPDAMPPATVPAFRLRNPDRRVFVCFEGDAPAGGWWDVEDHFSAVMPEHYPLAPRMCVAGSREREIWMRIELDRRMNLLRAGSLKRRSVSH
jgi:hypothetical protein